MKFRGWQLMSKQEKKGVVPELRFLEFQNDGEWESSQLGQISDRITEKVGDRKLTTVSITAGFGFVSQAEKFSRDISGKQYKNYIVLKKGEFSYNKGNSKTFPQGAIYKLKEFEEVAAPNSFISFRFNEKYTPDFYMGYFDNNYHGRQLLRYITSGARSDGLLNISPDDFFSIILPTPKEKREQQKVSDCLSSISDLITAQSEKLEELKDHKKGLLQQLFPAEGESVPKVRFPEFRDDGEWNPVRFGDVCTFVRGPFGGALKKEIFVDQGYAVYEQSHAIHQDFYSFRYFVDEEKFQELKRFEVKTNDIIMSCSGTMGKFAIVPKHAKKGVINQALLKLTVNEKNDLNFIKYTLEFPLNQKKLLSQSAGGAIKNVVGVGELKEICFPMPDILEQQKIADCLSSLDDLITAQAQKIESLKAHKKGLMQQLFPSVDEVEA